MNRRALTLALPLLLAAAACQCDDPGTSRVSGTIALDEAVITFGSVCLGDTRELRVGVRNLGPVPLLFEAVEAQGSPAFKVISSPESLSAVGSEGSEGEIVLTFKPAVSGDTFGDLVIQSSDLEHPTTQLRLTGVGDDGVRVDVALLCEGTDGTTLEACPATLNFEDVGVGASREYPIVVTNRGCAELTLSELAALTLDGAAPEPAFALASPQVPFVFSEAVPQAFSVTLTPAAADLYLGKLVATYSDHSVGASPAEASLTMMGQGVELQLVAEPENFFFASAAQGQPQTETFSVRNIGSSSGEIRAVTLRDGTPDFSVSAPGLPATVAPGQSYSFDVSYAPSDSGNDADALLVETSAGTLPEIPITGGAAPQIVVEPSTVDFGQVQTGGSATQQLTVKNNGTADLEVSALNLVTNPATVFSVRNAPALPTVVAPQGSFSFTLRFDDEPGIGVTPSGGGSSELGELAVVSDDPAFATTGGEYIVVLRTDTKANLAPTAAVRTTVEGTLVTTLPAPAITGQTVGFDASPSSDPNSDTLQYAWTIVNAPAGGQATLSGASGPTATLQPDFPGSWEVRLTVTDPFGLSSTALVQLSVRQP